MKLRSITIVLLGTFIAAPVFAGEAPLASKMPADALVYIGWSGRSLPFDGSLIGQLLAEPDIKRLCRAAHDALDKAIRAKGDPQADKAFKHLWAMGSIAWQHPAAVGLFDVKPPVNGGEPSPSGAFLIELGKDRAAFDAELQGLLALAPEELKITQAKIGDVTYRRFDTPAGPCGMGVIGNLFFMALGEGVAEQVVALAGGKAKSLATNPGFTEAMKDLAGDAVQAAWWVDIEKAYALVEEFAPDGAGGAPGKEVAEFRKGLKVAGLDRATRLVGVMNIVDRALHEKNRIYTPAPHRGLMLLMAGGPLPANALAGVPADADVVMTGRMDLSKVLNEFRNAAVQFDPKAAEQIDAALAEFGKAIESDVEKDLLAHLGDQWLICHAESLGGMFTGVVASVSVKNPAAFAPTLAKLEKALAEGVGGMGVGVKTMTSGNVKVRYVAGGSKQMPIPVAPAWTLHNGRLYLALYPQVVVAAAGGAKEKALDASPAFVALRKHVSPKASALGYVNTPRIVRRFYALGIVGWTTAANVVSGEMDVNIDPGMFPSLSKVEKYVRPGISAISSDDKGILIESYGSFSGAGLLWGFSPTQMLSLGMAMPSLSRARGQAKKSMSAANLNAIGKGLMLYQVEADDKMPPDLTTVVKNGSISAECLFSPLSGRKPRIGPDKMPIKPFDYVYLGGKMKRSAPGSLMVAYERPEHYKGKGTWILTYGSSVRWVDMADFRREQERTRKFIEKQNTK